MIQKLCEKLTNHKFRKYISRTTDTNPIEYYYRCRICGYVFWNYNKPKRKPKWDKEK